MTAICFLYTDVYSQVHIIIIELCFLKHYMIVTEFVIFFLLFDGKNTYINSRFTFQARMTLQVLS